MDNKITISVPATVANLVCGFDILGMALEGPCDRMELSMNSRKGIRITHTDGYGLPENPAFNVSGVALEAMMAKLDEDIGFDLTVHKSIKPGSGLGSSAAGAAGAVVAANHLLGNRFSKEELVQFAMFGEKLASGVKHADNIAPCIYGGITLIRAIHPLDIIAIPPPELFVTIVHPQIEVKTSDARQILRKEVLLKDAIRQWGNIAGLVTGLLQNNHQLISRSLEDVIIEPVRKILIPCFDEIKTASMNAGALGGGISGSGPSIFMLSSQKNIAEDIETLMQEIYGKIGIDFKTYVTKINPAGIKIIE